MNSLTLQEKEEALNILGCTEEEAKEHVWTAYNAAWEAIHLALDHYLPRTRHMPKPIPWVVWDIVVREVVERNEEIEKEVRG